ncbi:MAG: terminase [Micromonosporaceae bacterium]|nr:terminase [Micromonosporaceae bacterium]
MTSTVAALAPADRLDTLPPGLPELTLGYEAAAWAHRWLVQPNGPRAGKPFRLTDRQFRFICWWYAVDERGRWLFHHGVRRLAKGSGKSPAAAVLALIEFCAPVRLVDFDAKALGGCRGRVVDLPLVQIAATAESQTANTMRMVRAFASKRSRVVAEYELDPGKTKYYKLPEGTLEVITSSGVAAEGAEASFIVADETEHWKPANGGPFLASTLADNLAKSGSRMLETSNAWVPGQESVAEATWDAWVAQEEGRVRAQTRMLYDAVIAPPDLDMADRPALFAAIEQLYIDCLGWIDPHAIVNRIHDPRSNPSDSRRKYLNRPTAADDAWLAPWLWEACSAPDVDVAEGDEVVLFFDGSKSQDSTALVGCRMSDGHLFLIGAWERPPGPTGSGWQVSVDEVDAVVDWAFERYEVVACYADVREWESFVHTAWPDRYAEQLLVWAQKTGKSTAAIAWDMRAHVLDFTRAAETLHTEVVERQVTHDGSAVLSRHVTNCRQRHSRWGISVGKESPGSPKKIDAAVCAIGARMVRRHVLASPEWAERGKRSRGGRVVGWG